LRPLQQTTTTRLHAPRRLAVGADESFVFVTVELGSGRFPWDSLGIALAIDTYRPDVGQHRLPQGQTTSELGFEFLLDLVTGERSSLKVTPDYNRYDSQLDPGGDDFGRFTRRPAATRNRSDGRFDSLFIITNRARFGRNGTFYRARGYDRGQLRYGTESQSSLADWYLDEAAGLLELRIPWDLLNVTDPSSRTLLDDQATSGAVGTVEARDFHFGLLVYSKANHKVVASLPRIREGGWKKDQFVAWAWSGWTEPSSHARLKPVYDSLRLLWEGAEHRAQARPERKGPSN
jgi:hypothetical protein